MEHAENIDDTLVVKNIVAGLQTRAQYGIILDEQCGRLRIEIIEDQAPAGVFRGRYSTNKTVPASATVGILIFEGSVVNLSRFQAEHFTFFGDISGGGDKEIMFEQFKQEQERSR